jgi:zinc protease
VSRGSTSTACPTACACCSSPIPPRPTITVNITYLVGSRHEDYGETGMAHLLEHLMFKGSTNHPNVPKELKDHGARPNGTTSFDRTNYFETFQATDENLNWALEPGGRPDGQLLHRQEGSRQRDDGGPQRVRAGENNPAATS